MTTAGRSSPLNIESGRPLCADSCSLAAANKRPLSGKQTPELARVFDYPPECPSVPIARSTCSTASPFRRRRSHPCRLSRHASRHARARNRADRPPNRNDRCKNAARYRVFRSKYLVEYSSIRADIDIIDDMCHSLRRRFASH